MISALLDNYLYQHQADGFGLKEIIWRRVLDVNDRSLRSIVTGLGPSTNGITEESGFDITPASEIMAILCLATDLDDLRRRIENIILGFRFDGTPFTVKELGVAGAITVLLKDAINPTWYRLPKALLLLFMEDRSQILPMVATPFLPQKWP